MKYGYARLSSTTLYGKNKDDSNSLEAQEKKLRDAGCTEIVLEEYTGIKADRPKFARLVDNLQPGDTLVVCKLDTFARTAADGVTLIKELFNRGIFVHVLNMGLVEDTQTGRLVLTIMMAFAEYERDMIIERFNDGKAEARANNPDYCDGRRYLEVPEFDSYMNRVINGEISVKEAYTQLGISRSKWYTEFNKRPKPADLLNKTVNHKMFGIGKIIDVKDTYVLVEFSSKTTKIAYPRAFESCMRAIDDNVQEYIITEIEKAKKAEEEKKQLAAEKRRAMEAEVHAEAERLRAEEEKRAAEERENSVN